jgi:hypothetical protein
MATRIKLHLVLLIMATSAQARTFSEAQQDYGDMMDIALRAERCMSLKGNPLLSKTTYDFAEVETLMHRYMMDQAHNPDLDEPLDLIMGLVNWRLDIVDAELAYKKRYGKTCT